MLLPPQKAGGSPTALRALGSLARLLRGSSPAWLRIRSARRLRGYSPSSVDYPLAPFGRSPAPRSWRGAAPGVAIAPPSGRAVGGYAPGFFFGYAAPLKKTGRAARSSARPQIFLIFLGHPERVTRPKKIKKKFRGASMEIVIVHWFMQSRPAISTAAYA